MFNEQQLHTFNYNDDFREWAEELCEYHFGHTDIDVFLNNKIGQSMIWYYEHDYTVEQASIDLQGMAG